MKIGIVQVNTIPGDVSSNCARIPDWAADARERGCDAVIFPEMIDTGYDLSLLPGAASTWEGDDEGSPLGIARKAAADSGVYVIAAGRPLLTFEDGEWTSPQAKSLRRGGAEK